MKKIEIRENGTKRVYTTDFGDSLCQQHHKDECDVNKIIKKYQKTGQITHIARQQGFYADLSQQGDYMEAMLTVMKAKDAFMTLPSELRKECANDPALFLKMLNDPSQKEKLIKYGIIEKPKPKIAETKPTPETPPKNA